ncbi:MAG: hypothetical protein KAQ62_02860 [Cyclobacteriaceae bacterium]|nr:hypothetical protein [Cyclobacteriaceae bacterium]
MKKIFKTASIVTSGIIVGALVRKYARQALIINRESAIDSIKSVKNIFHKSTISEELDNYFV